MISIKDNDSLAARLAAEVDADLLILMSDVDGIYTCPPSEEGARLINTYTPENAVSIQYGQKSRVGTGGMDSKVTSVLYIRFSALSCVMDQVLEPLIVEMKCSFCVKRIAEFTFDVKAHVR